MNRSTSRDRDKRRKYKPGSVKRQEKAEEIERTGKFPKITQKWNVPAGSESGTSHSGEGFASERASTSTDGTAQSDISRNICEQATSNCGSVPGRVEVEQGEEVGGSADERFENDVGLWPKKLSEQVRSYWLGKGSSEYQNCHSDFKESAIREQDRIRHCTRTLFTSSHSLSGEEIDLKWLCYSKATGKVYCFVCKLMSNEEFVHNRV